MDAPAEAAIGAGDHVFTTDNLRKANDAIGDQFGMLHNVGGMAGQHQGSGLPSGSLTCFQTFHSCS